MLNMQLHNNLNLIATNQLIYINLKLYQLTLNIQQPKKKYTTTNYTNTKLITD